MRVCFLNQDSESDRQYWEEVPTLRSDQHSPQAAQILHSTLYANIVQAQQAVYALLTLIL